MTCVGPRSELRFFYAHAKVAEADEAVEVLEAEVERLLQLCRTKLAAHRVVITTGLDDYNRSFRYCRGFPGWTARVATGLRQADRQPHYHAIVVPDEVVGRATFDILQKALAGGKPVLWWDRAAALQRVTSVAKNPGGGYTAAARVLFGAAAVDN